MRAASSWFAIVLVVIVTGACRSTSGAAPSGLPSPPSSDLALEHLHRRRIVLPKPSAEQMHDRAQQSVDNYVDAMQVRDLIGRTSPLQPPARPDLGDDVTQGIQTQRLRDQLRGR